jgi:hypothetical protein
MKALEDRADAVVDFGEMGSLRALAMIWGILVPGVEFPSARTLMLLDLNVQVPYERRLKEATRCRG